MVFGGLKHLENFDVDNLKPEKKILNKYFNRNYFMSNELLRPVL